MAAAEPVSRFARKEPRAQDLREYDSAASAKLDRGLGIALVGVGAAGLATAAILFFTGRAPIATPVAVLSREGAWVGIEGRLP